MLVDRSVCHVAAYHKCNVSIARVGHAKSYKLISSWSFCKCCEFIQTLSSALEILSQFWKQFTNTHGENIVPTTRMSYKRSVFEGDSLSPLLFWFCHLSLSIKLKRGSGYMVELLSRRKHKITRLFFADDLKLYVSNEKNLLAVLETVFEYTATIGMSFGWDKCSVCHVHKSRGLNDGRDTHLVDGSIMEHLNGRKTSHIPGNQERSTQVI